MRCGASGLLRTATCNGKKVGRRVSTRPVVVLYFVTSSHVHCSRAVAHLTLPAPKERHQQCPQCAAAVCTGAIATERTLRLRIAHGCRTFARKSSGTASAARCRTPTAIRRAGSARSATARWRSPEYCCLPGRGSGTLSARMSPKRSPYPVSSPRTRSGSRW